MDYESASRIATIGVVIEVTNGEPEPPQDFVRQWGKWRRRNFTGTVVEKDADRMVVQVEDNGNILPFVVTQEMDCSFSFPTLDLALAEQVALEKVENDAEAVTKETVNRFRRLAAINRSWGEVQLLKLANATGNIPTDLVERRKMFPTLMALVNETGNSLATVATAVENRLWDRVRQNAIWEAKLIVGHDTVRAATTVEEKLAAADNIVWSE